MLLLRQRHNATSHNLIGSANVGLTITQPNMINGIISLKT